MALLNIFWKTTHLFALITISYKIMFRYIIIISFKNVTK